MTGDRGGGAEEQGQSQTPLSQYCYHAKGILNLTGRVWKPKPLVVGKPDFTGYSGPTFYVEPDSRLRFKIELSVFPASPLLF